MTPDIERLAKEAGFTIAEWMAFELAGEPVLSKFAALIVEECDRELFRMAQLIPPNGEAHMMQREALFDGAQAIRAKFALSRGAHEAK